MRVVLGCSMGGTGHLLPVVAVAHALDRLGHETVVLVPPSLAAAAGEAGVEVAVGEQPAAAVVAEIWRRVRAGPEREVRGLIDRELFAERASDAMRPAAEALCARLRPSLVVREACEYATAIAAHRAGVPQVQVGVSLSRIDHGVFGDLRATIEHREPGLWNTIEGGPYLTSFPASLDPPAWPRTCRFRRAAPAPRELPDWWPGDTRPLLYLTFGTVLGTLAEAAGVYRAALDAVAGLPVRVLLTVGPAIEPAALGAIPANTHVERWVDQHDVFAQAALMVCHGGSGTVFGALAAGLPMVICPLFADQSANASLLERAGAGAVYRPAERHPGGVARLGPDDVTGLRAVIAQTLAEPGLAVQARRLAAEIGATPALEDVLGELLASLGADSVYSDQ